MQAVVGFILSVIDGLRFTWWKRQQPAQAITIDLYHDSFRIAVTEYDGYSTANVYDGIELVQTITGEDVNRAIESAIRVCNYLNMKEN